MKYLARTLFVYLIGLTSLSTAETTRSDQYREDAIIRDLDVTSFGLSANCRKFIDAQGQLGEWGKALIESFERVGTDCFYEEADFSRLCPNFSSFTKAKKNQFYAFAFATVAHYESTCRSNAQAQGTNDLAVGLFQLENSRHQRKEADRHELCGPGVSIKNTKEIDYQMRCAAGIFSDYHCNKTDDRWCRVGTCGYWQKWRTPQRKISKIISRFPSCNY